MAATDVAAGVELGKAATPAAIPCTRCGGPGRATPERVAACELCRGTGELANAARWLTS